MRSIKPEFFTDPDLGEFSPLHRLLYAGLWCHEDRAGRVEDKPRDLKVRILPYDDCDVDRMLQDFHVAGFIIRYEVDSIRYLCTPTFLKHQRPHITERPSQLPPPPGAPPTSGPSGGLTVRAPTANGAVTVKHTLGNGAGTGAQPCREGYKTPGAGAGAGAGAGSTTPLPPAAAWLRVVPSPTAVPLGGGEAEAEEPPPTWEQWQADWDAERDARGRERQRISRTKKADRWRQRASRERWPGTFRAYLDPERSRGLGFAKLDWPIEGLFNETVFEARVPPRPPPPVFCGQCGELAEHTSAGEWVKDTQGRASCHGCATAYLHGGGA